MVECRILMENLTVKMNLSITLKHHLHVQLSVSTPCLLISTIWNKIFRQHCYLYCMENSLFNKKCFSFILVFFTAIFIWKSALFCQITSCFEWHLNSEFSSFWNSSSTMLSNCNSWFTVWGSCSTWGTSLCSWYHSCS